MSTPSGPTPLDVTHTHKETGRSLTMSTDNATMSTNSLELRHGPRGAIMKPEPINMPLAQIAARLDAGDTVSVHLEPGDATRYDLILVPVWAKHVNASLLGYAEHEHDFIVCINAQDAHVMRGCAVQNGGYYGELLENGVVRLPWTVTLLEWWFEQHLWPRIEAVRGDRVARP